MALGMFAGFFLGRGLWIAHGSTARISVTIFLLNTRFYHFYCFVFFLLSFRATIDIYSIAKAGKKDMVMFCLIIR